MAECECPLRCRRRVTRRLSPAAKETEIRASFNNRYYTRIEEHARRAAGAAIGAVDLALRGEKAFALMRPPGHHATSTEAMGFCYLNSIAIAAHYALAIGRTRCDLGF